MASNLLCTLDAADMFHTLASTRETSTTITAKGEEVAMDAAILGALRETQIAKASTKFGSRHFF